MFYSPQITSIQFFALFSNNFGCVPLDLERLKVDEVLQQFLTLFLLMSSDRFSESFTNKLIGIG